MNDTITTLLASGTRPNPTGTFMGLRVVALAPGEPPMINIGGDVLHDPASLTKLMTFYLACRAGVNAPQEVTISDHARDPARILKHTPSYSATKIGDTLPFATAMGAATIASDNVAATAIAEALGKGKTPGDRHRDFVLKMNATAKELGLTSTRFANASGLPLDAKLDQTTQPAVTSANDMAKLLTTIYREYPNHAKEYLESNGIHYGRVAKPKGPNHHLNDINSPSYVGRDVIRVGAKTGYTKQALHNIASMVTDINGNQLAVVVLGSGWTPLDKATALGGDITYPSNMVTSKSVKGDLVRDALSYTIIHRWAADNRVLQQQVCSDLLVKSANPDITLPPGIVSTANAAETNSTWLKTPQLPKIIAMRANCPAR